MSQKHYIYEIVLQLNTAENHIRGLAKKLKTNQMMISRRIKELMDANAIDYKFEGRNKVFFLKRSIEAQEYSIIAEHFRLLAAIEDYPVLRNIVQEIKANPYIGLAIIFGSYAKWLAHEDSDIDVYIETTDRSIRNEIELLNSKISVKLGDYDADDLLIKEIEKNHIIIKGAEKYHEKSISKFAERKETSDGGT